MSQLDEAIAEILEPCSPGAPTASYWCNRAVDILRRHFSEPPTVAGGDVDVPESPSDLSFNSVNEFVHQPDQLYEHLQWLCLTLACALEKETVPVADAVAAAYETCAKICWQLSDELDDRDDMTSEQGMAQTCAAAIRACSPQPAVKADKPPETEGVKYDGEALANAHAEAQLLDPDAELLAAFEAGKADVGIDIDERNAGAESFAKILLSDNGSGEMTPGPCADALAMVRRLKTDCDKAVLMADMIADKWTSENSKASLLLELEALAKEIDRLATALHANRCHPDYDYVPIWTTPALVTVMESGGWERCPEAETHGILDEVWRRKREPA